MKIVIPRHGQGGENVVLLSAITNARLPSNIGQKSSVFKHVQIHPGAIELIDYMKGVGVLNPKKILPTISDILLIIQLANTKKKKMYSFTFSQLTQLTHFSKLFAVLV